MKKFLFTCHLLLLVCMVHANNIQVSNMRVGTQDTTKHTISVSFDLSWKNSWRTSTGPANWDAAWVFMKYRLVGTDTWLPVYLAAQGHQPGVGASLEVGLKDHASPYSSVNNPGLGVFVYRSVAGDGTFSLPEVKLLWDYTANGLPNNIGQVEVRVFAIEMVLVPEGGFFIGSGGNETNHFHKGDNPAEPFAIHGESEIAIGTGAEQLLYTADDTLGGDRQGPIPTAFPKGFRSFYSMKYEVSNQQYADFLNTIDKQQAAYRWDRNKLSLQSNLTPKIEAMETGFIVPVDGDAVCNYLSPLDGLAYADWAGLRPMTELEFEKASRGTLAPVPNEYAWGDTTLANGRYSFSDPGLPMEQIAENYRSDAGNALYANNTLVSNNVFNKLPRVGIFAANPASTSRASAGASYWGIMELSGSVYELCVSVGSAAGRAFTGSHGDGILDTLGDANVALWPGATNTGLSLRGGVFSDNASALRVSDRFSGGMLGMQGSFGYATKDVTSGFRGVRTVGVHHIPVDTFCGAYIAPGVWREFMCHNLGAANTDADPFTPSWEINGGYWQWGRKEMAAAGPSGPSVAESNSGEIAGWNTLIAPRGSWIDMEKKVNDPCPAGYRVPTKAQWDGVRVNNPIQTVGSLWTASNTNYATGKLYGDRLFLPAAGYRNGGAGRLYNRGELGLYWSSSESGSYYAWSLDFDHSGVGTNDGSYCTDGKSLRCISENPGISAIPNIKTNAVTLIATRTASGSGEVIIEGRTPVTARGVVWDTVSGPTVALATKTIDGSGAGIYASALSGLKPGRRYYIRAYATNSAGTGYGEELEFTTLKDTCGAYIAPGVWREFMCHNLGSANTDADPFTPSWEINGGYWQWGRKEMAAAGPSGPTEVESNAGEIAGWNTTDAPDGSWSDAVKTVNDPCPAGYRLPTHSQWLGVIENNTKTYVGSSWISEVVNYSTGLRFGEKLFLPAAWGRYRYTGRLFGRGSDGNYYSSSERAWGLDFGQGTIGTGNGDRTSGRSLRCISEEPGTSVIPSIRTSIATSIVTRAASSGGEVIMEGSAPVTARGVVWDTVSSPTVGLTTKTIDGSGAGSYTSALSGLKPGRRYYVRAYATNSAGTGYGEELEFTTLKDTCGAYIAPGVWREFMCHNLGSTNTDADPFTPSWEINGGYWQWGRKEMAAAGPSGPSAAEANSGEIAGWNITFAPNGSWNDSEKTANDPCPAGYRVPTRSQWLGVIENNTQTYVGSSWTSGITNYNTGLRFGEKLFLPAVGYRLGHSGGGDYHGYYGYYWSSLDYGADISWSLFFGYGSVGTHYYDRKTGRTLRCISEEPGTSVIPSIKTSTVTSISTRAASIGGEVIMEGSAPVTARGVVWDTVSSPTEGLTTKTIDGNGAGSYTSALSGLKPGRRYYVRAYATNSAGTGYGEELEFTTLKDTCGAYIAPGVWREFMCHNLGSANTDADPFTPSWEINGGYWQWGRKEMAAAGPSGPSEAESNSGEIAGWNTSFAPNGSWNDSEKTANDPCPAGYRVPSKVQWDGVIGNNQTQVVGSSWVSSNNTNYSTGRLFGDKFFLSSAGDRSNDTGRFGSRGYNGGYWSSSENGSDNAWDLYFDQSHVDTYSINRTYGKSLRCISEEPGTSVIPSIKTTTATSIGTRAASIGGEVTAEGSAPVTARGVVWDTVSSPTVALTTKTTDGGGAGSYTSTLSGLKPGRRYYVRAYATNSAGTGYGEQLEFTTLKDTCGAYIAPGVWREFMCHNLGSANTEADPFTPSWEINGGYWQWGRKEMAAAGPSGPSEAESNSREIAGWNTTVAPNGSWSDAEKTVNDPCPKGYRVPTKTQWDGVMANNTIQTVGNTWISSPTNYTTGKLFGEKLFLPAPGDRDYYTGLLSFRGEYGFYWSSSESESSYAWRLYFRQGNVDTDIVYRTDGRSLRCISEEPGTSVIPNTKTSTVTSISTRTASSGGEVIMEGSAPVTVRGVVWDTVSGPTVALATKTTDGGGAGSYTSMLSGLKPGRRYYIRAYATNSAGTGYGEEIKFTTLKDTCGAYIAPGVWREFMCHNLGAANTDADPFTPSWEINGGYWQWGRKEMAAAGPSGPSEAESNSGEIVGWNTTLAADSSWSDVVKTVHDPCPAGYRIPSKVQWVGVKANNPIQFVGSTWTFSPTNYATGTLFGEKLFLPAAGYRYISTGRLDYRGDYGDYWSSSELGSSFAWDLSFTRGGIDTHYGSRTDGRTLRCISEEPGTSVVPNIKTSAVTSIGTRAASVGGEVIMEGSAPVTAHGVVWDTVSSPTVGLTTKTIDGSGAGTYTSPMSGLKPGRRYYVRVYATNSAGTGYGEELEFTTLKDTCGAYIAPGVWREFMCHNLGSANTDADPFTPSWEINGGYWQWGRKEMAAAGPSGPSEAESNSGEIAGWNTTFAANGSWSDVVKTVNDPCPAGYRVPTRSQWLGVIENNTQTFSGGSWTAGITNYNTGLHFGEKLFLPAAGNRYFVNGRLDHRGYFGIYWSSSESLSSYAWYLGYSTLSMYSYERTDGRSIRCISENPGTSVIPSIKTTTVTSISTRTASSGGEVTMEGTTPITARGVVWDTISEPTVALTTKTIDGSGAGIYTSALSGLKPGRRYYVRAYATNSAGTGYGEELEFTTLKDTCGAYIAPGVWREFMCHNLGAANTDADPFTPSWEINGGYWQWGRKAMAGGGPSGPSEAEANIGEIAGWDATNAPDGSWSDALKTANDPCPSGYRVPTYVQWLGVIENNPKTYIGSSWTVGAANYTTGLRFGEKLFLPAAGGRDYFTGGTDGRGFDDFYWSSDPLYIHAWGLYIYQGGVRMDTNSRNGGRSIRCISE